MSCLDLLTRSVIELSFVCLTVTYTESQRCDVLQHDDMLSLAFTPLNLVKVDRNASNSAERLADICSDLMASHRDVIL